MKIFSKKLTSLIAIFMFLAVQLSPGFALAKSSESKVVRDTNQKVVNNSGDFCDKLDYVSQKMIKDGSGKKAKDMGMKNMDESQLYELRNQADSKRQEHYQKLYDKYSAPEQRTAIDEYRKTMTAAIEQRRAAVDTARLNYVGELNKLIDSHQRKTHDSEQNIINAVQSAYTKSKNSCSSGLGSSEVKSVFKNDIKFAKETFVRNKEEIALDKDRFDAIKKVRESSLQSAIDDFKKTAQEAKTKLAQSLDK